MRDCFFVLFFFHVYKLLLIKESIVFVWMNFKKKCFDVFVINAKYYTLKFEVCCTCKLYIYIVH